MKAQLGNKRSLALAALVTGVAAFGSPASAGPQGAVADRQITYKNVSFTYDSSLATSVTARTDPRREGDDEPIWEIAPEHSLFLFNGYPSEEEYPGEVRVYPTEAYAQINDLADEQIKRLRPLLASKPNLAAKYPVYEIERTVDQLPPFNPPANAALVLTAKMQYLDMKNGSGVRYLMYGMQDCSYIEETRLLYTVQGLANNGKDYVSLVFPVRTAQKISTPPRPQSGRECQVYDAYNKTLGPKIQNLKSSDFVPNLDTLDNVFKSMSTVPVVTSMTFPQTGITVDGRFWQVWQGGRDYDTSLYLNGLPLTAPRMEVSATDGKSYLTQWFERARFEAHPENAAPNDVLLGLLGVAAAKFYSAEPPFARITNPNNGTQWFSQTGHTLGDTSEGGWQIAARWANMGGLAQYGYPLSQPFMETSKDDGRQYLVQYFERQRMEYHPEFKGQRAEVLMGRLGAEQKGNSR